MPHHIGSAFSGLTEEQREACKAVLRQSRGNQHGTAMGLPGYYAPNRPAEGWTLLRTPSTGTPHTVVMRLWHRGVVIREVVICEKGNMR